MTQTVLRLSLGAIAGLLVGLLPGGTYVNWWLGAGLTAGDPLILITGFPGMDGLRTSPWRQAYLGGLAFAAAFMALAALLSASQKLTEYGQAKFQTKAEMKRNDLLKPFGSGFVFVKLGKPTSRTPVISAAFTKFPHCLVVAPTRAGKGVGYVIPKTLLFPGSAVILDVKGEDFRGDLPAPAGAWRSHFPPRAVRFRERDTSLQPAGAGRQYQESGTAPYRACQNRGLFSVGV
jgi:type IV secretion system protein VirD4